MSRVQIERSTKMSSYQRSPQSNFEEKTQKPEGFLCRNLRAFHLVVLIANSLNIATRYCQGFSKSPLSRYGKLGYRSKNEVPGTRTPATCGCVAAQFDGHRT